MKKTLNKDCLKRAKEILMQPTETPPSQEEFNQAALKGKCALCNRFNRSGRLKEIYRDNETIGYICLQCGTTIIAAIV